LRGRAATARFGITHCRIMRSDLPIRLVAGHVGRKIGFEYLPRRRAVFIV
jgi:hypothetical protein